MKRPQLFKYRFELDFKERGRTHLCGDIRCWVDILAENEQEARENLTMHVILTYQRRIECQDEITTTLTSTEPFNKYGVLDHGMRRW